MVDSRTWEILWVDEVSDDEEIVKGWLIEDPVWMLLLSDGVELKVDVVFVIVDDWVLISCGLFSVDGFIGVGFVISVCNDIIIIW